MLDERKAAILRAVVQEYIETAQPVGSTTAASTAGVAVSSATVRNDMAALEAEGFLQQPHTSAGRVPTEKGYRFFVDSLDETPLARGDRRQVLDFFRHMRGELEDLMRDTAGLLSGLTDYAAVVVDHSIEGATVRSFQLVPLAPRTALAVVVFSNGVVAKHTLELDADHTDDEMEAAGRIVAEAVEGAAVGQARSLAPSGDRALDHLASQVLASTDGAGAEPDRVYVDGASRVVSRFDAVDSVTQVLSILEQQLVVVSLMADVLDRGLNVAIGTETGLEPLEECSVVVSPYEIDGAPAGSIAVLGPTRMNYPQTMAAVAVVSRQLGRRLSEG